VSASLVDDDETRAAGPNISSNAAPAAPGEVKNALAGSLVSSLHKLKDTDNSDGGFFVFGDLSVKLEGFFKLQFTLFEIRDQEVEYIKSTTSQPFQVHPSKTWQGMMESTVLTRSFSDQGVRLRLRKEPRLRLGARGPASDDYQPRHYNTSRRRAGQQSDPSQQPPSTSPGTQNPNMLSTQRFLGQAEPSPQQIGMLLPQLVAISDIHILI
jgi:hypothetical protein